MIQYYSNLKHNKKYNKTYKNSNNILPIKNKIKANPIDKNNIMQNHSDTPTGTQDINIYDEPFKTPIQQTAIDYDQSSILTPKTVNKFNISSPTFYVSQQANSKNPQAQVARLPNITYETIPINLNNIKSSHKSRDEFNKNIRHDFLTNLANEPNINSIFSQNNIERLKNGLVPFGYEVHHKIPLQLSGNNEKSNLILIKSNAHRCLTSYQAKVISCINKGGNIYSKVNFPIPKGEIYSQNPEWKSQ